MSLGRSATLRAVVPHLLAIAAALSGSATAQAQLRIVDYNTAGNAPADMLTVFRAIGEEVRNGVAKPIDVLSLQEQTTLATTTQALVDLLNSYYGAGTYARSTRVVSSSGAGQPGLIYNTRTVQLLSEGVASTVSSSGAARQTVRWQLRPVGYDAAADFYLYGSHYKANNDAASADRRAVEAAQVRANADALGEGTNLIFTGDFNVYTSAEPMYQTLTAPGPGQALDPLNPTLALQAWDNNAAFTAFHTQSPCTSGCGVGGGVDSRFDFQLSSGEVQDGEGFALIPGSYHPFGNNGTTFNQAVNSASNTVQFPGLTSFTRSQVLNALATVTDHLPVVADYQVPAVQSVQLASAAPRFIRGASGAATQLSVAVTNTASVVATAGADDLAFSVSTTGDLSGGGAGSALALAGASTSTVSLATGVAGARSGQVRVDAASPATQNGRFAQSVNWTVVDPANPSFAAGQDLDDLTIDFGRVTQGAQADPIAFLLDNLVTTAGFTSSLDLDSIQAAGATSILSTSLAPFAGLAAGAALSFQASLDTSTVGQYSALYLLTLSDEDAPGQTQHTLSLSLFADIVAATLPGDYNGDGVVDAADYTTWRDTLGSASSLAADGDGSGVVDQADYDVWAAHYGDAAPAANAVPEPSTGLAVAFAAVLVPAAWCRSDRRDLAASLPAA